jgi:hypothetical protein
MSNLAGKQWFQEAVAGVSLLVFVASAFFLSMAGDALLGV